MRDSRKKPIEQAEQLRARKAKLEPLRPDTKRTSRKTGIDIIGDAPWGTHFCQFYQTKEDLLDILVPYFKTGLENNEFCMWVTSEPLSSEDAKRSLKQAVKNLDGYIKKGQIEILDYSRWYTKSGKFEADKVMHGWVEKHDQALKRGFDGLRLTGNTFWLEMKDWGKFVDYEAVINKTIGKYKMIAFCTYSLDRCGANELIDVVNSHQFAVTKRQGRWEIVESAERKKATEALRRSKEEWEKTFNAISDWVSLTDLTGRILRTNRAGEDFTGVTLAEIVGQSCCKLVHGSEKHIPGCPLVEMLGTRERASSAHQVPDTDQWVMVTVDPVTDEQGKIIGAVHITRDITGRKLFENEQEITIELLNLLNAPNQKHELMKLVTKFLKDWSGCEAIGIRLQEGEDFPYYVTSGFPEEFVLAESKLCSVNELGEIERDSQGRPYLECMCGNVISGRFDPSKWFFTEHGSFWVNSTTELLATTTDTDRQARTRNRCNTAGYESVALIPLRAGGEIFGLLQFNDKQKGRFTPEKILLFERLADNLAIGLAQRRVEEALRQSEAELFTVLNNVPAILIVVDRERRIRRANKAAVEFGRRTPDQMMGLHGGEALRCLHSLDDPKGCGYGRLCETCVVRNTVLETFKTGKSCYQAEAKLPFDIDGKTEELSLFVSTTTLEISSTPMVLVCLQDITERKKDEEKRIEAEREKTACLDAMFDGVIMHDLKGSVIAVNPAWEKMHGYKREEVEKLSPQEFFPKIMSPDSIKKAQSIIKTAIKEGISGRAELSVHARDGREFPAWISFSPIKDEKGNATGMVVSTRDITEHKKAEELLKDSENKLKTYINSIAMGISIISPRMEVLDMNEIFKGWFPKVNISKKPKCYKSFYDPPKEEICTYCPTVKAFKDGKVHFSETDLCVGGNYYLVTAAPLKDDKGKVTAVIETVQNITERKKAEETLQKSEEQLKDIFEGAVDGIIYTDRKGNVIEVNPAFTDITGILRKEVVGKNAVSLVKKFAKPKDLPRLLKAVGQMLKGVPIELYEVEVNDKIVEISTPTLRKDAGGITGIMRDITEPKKAEEKIKLFSHAIEGAIDAIEITDMKGIFTYANPAMEEVFGYKKGELIGKHVSALNLNPEITEQILSTLIKTGSWDGEVLQQKKNKETFPALLSLSTVKDEKGDPVATMGAVRDITERKKAEDALRESEEKYREIVELAPDGIVTVDLKGMITSCNTALLEQTGYSKEDFVGKHISKIPTARLKDIPKYLKLFGSLLRGKIPEPFEFIWIHKDGTKYWGDVCVSILKREGRKVGFQAITRDITERKKAQEAYRTLVDHSLQGLAIFQDRCVVFANQAMAEITGYTVDEMLSMSSEQVQAFVHPEYQRLVWSRHQQRLKGKQVPEHYELRGIRKDGSTCWLEIHASRIEYQGKPAIQAAYVDITERRKAEEALRQSERRFRTVVENSPDFILLVKRDGIIFDVNRLANGYTREMVIGQSVFNEDWYETKDQAVSARKQIEHVFRTGESGSFEYAQRAPHGSLSFYETRVAPFEQDTEGSILSVQCATRDITERKKAEEVIRKLAKFPAENPSPVLRISAHGTIIYGNKASLPLLKIWGCRVGRSIPDQWYEFVLDGLSSGENRQTEVACDGRTFSLTFAPVIKANYVNVYGLDITERKKAEKELHDYQTELKSLASQLTLVEEHERRRLAMELHDRIGQSLVISKLGLDTARDSGSSADLAKALNEATKEIEQLIQEVRSLTFELSSPILYELGFETAVADWLTERIRKKHGIATEFEDDGQPKGLDDDTRAVLFRDVRELLTNVVKHAQAKSVKVSIRKVGSQIHVNVEDDGCGFDPAEIAATATKAGGFGLFSIRERLKQLEGNIEIQSAPGRGTRVTLTVPLKQ